MNTEKGCWLRPFAPILILALLGARAHAEITYLTQERKVSVIVGPSYIYKELVAPDFGPFSASLEFNVPDPPSPDSFGKATQSSSLQSTGMYFEGTGEGADNYGSGGAGAGLGTSSFKIQFELATAQSFVLNYDVKASYNNGGSSFSFLLKSATNIFSLDWGTFPTNGTMDGTLDAGVYVFSGSLTDGWSGFATGYGKGSFTMNLLIPSPPVAMLAFGSSVIVAVRRRR